MKKDVHRPAPCVPRKGDILALFWRHNPAPDTQRRTRRKTWRQSGTRTGCQCFIPRKWPGPSGGKSARPHSGSAQPPAESDEGDGGGTHPERDRRPAARKEAGRYRERERRMFWKSLMAAWGSRNTPRKRKESGKLLLVKNALSGVFLQKKSDRQKCLSGPNVGSKTFTAT